MSEVKERDPWKDPFEIEAISIQSRVVNEVILRLEPQIEKVITADLASRVKKIYVTGCGDSHYAGVASRLAFERYTRIPTEALESLEFSRYVVEYIPEDSLLFGISNSGQVSRSIESIILARKNGAYTIAITGYPEGPLARAADTSLIQTVPDLSEDWGPYSVGSLGLGNFIASLLALYLSAFRLAELKGKLSHAEVEELKNELRKSADIISHTAAQNQTVARDLAIKYWHLDTFFILGGGPNYGTALFSAAKLFEQPHQNGVAIQLEEWAHEQYFLTRPNVTPIFIIVPPGNSRDRAIEQLQGAKDMGGTVIAVCDNEDKEVIGLADFSMQIVGKLREEFSPLAYIVPNQLFATFLHQVKGRPPLIPPYDTQRMMDVNFRQIFHSKIKES